MVESRVSQLERGLVLPFPDLGEGIQSISSFHSIGLYTGGPCDRSDQSGSLANSLKDQNCNTRERAPVSNRYCSYFALVVRQCVRSPNIHAFQRPVHHVGDAGDLRHLLLPVTREEKR